MVSIGMVVTLGSNISARWLRSYFSTLQSAHSLEGVAGFDFRASLVYWRGGVPVMVRGQCGKLSYHGSHCLCTHLLNDGYVLSHGLFLKKGFIPTGRWVFNRC